MTAYRVQFQQMVRYEMTVEADSLEAAVRLATETKPVVAANQLQPSWVDTQEAVERTGCFNHEVAGFCGRCKTPLVHQEIPGQDYTYAMDSEDPDDTMICFACHQAQKAESRSG